MFNLDKLEDTLKTEPVDEVENEEVFDLIETPKEGGVMEDSLKSKYKFDDKVYEK